MASIIGLSGIARGVTNVPEAKRFVAGIAAAALLPVVVAGGLPFCTAAVLARVAVPSDDAIGQAVAMSANVDSYRSIADLFCGLALFVAVILGVLAGYRTFEEEMIEPCSTMMRRLLKSVRLGVYVGGCFAVSVCAVYSVCAFRVSRVKPNIEVTAAILSCGEPVSIQGVRDGRLILAGSVTLESGGYVPAEAALPWKSAESVLRTLNPMRAAMAIGVRDRTAAHQPSRAQR